jgi:pyruvate/2-oxoglutarate dehydrogenase complex dihydrolipoamide acyltransferase (E2) component
MMKWNFDDSDGRKFKKGVRYNLVVSHAEEGESANKGTPFLKIHLETEALEKAYDKTLWNTEKAAYRAKEWARALGFVDQGDVDMDADSLKGIRITAECSYYKGDDDREYIEWINPLPVKIGDPAPAAQAPAAAPAPAPAQAAQPPANNTPVEEVPF